LTDYQFRFKCPVCGATLKAKAGRFECKHKNSSNPIGRLSDPDKFELDEVHFELVILTTKEGE